MKVNSMKTTGKDLDTAARRARQYRDQESDQAQEYKTWNDEQDEKELELDTKNALMALLFLIVMLGGVFCLAWAVVAFVKFIVTL
jgi:NADH:ubiquinone oxidoreductase subunit 3 (subunit A)